MRRSLDGVFPKLPAGDAVWRCAAGPDQTPVSATIAVGPTVVLAAEVIALGPLTGPLACAIAAEHDGLLFGRFRHDGTAIVAEQAILGGHTLHDQEVRIATWAVGWTAGAYRARWERHAAGAAIGGDLPVSQVEPRRGADERIASTTTRVERILNERFESFLHDPHWGYHGAFGSARVFVTVRHTLEVSTAVIVSSPILSGVELTDALALELHAIAAERHYGRFAFAADRAELWFEHAVLGDDLDAEELLVAIDAVASVADREDDALQARHGGRRYADL